ncbi:MAG: serine hydrolase [Parasphingorhabdus sp.]|uniref:serine hydrolase n=1 Tax=Parasphingorhabdus sp. TaxID=2709688 RepID=UPI0032973EBA
MPNRFIRTFFFCALAVTMALSQPVFGQSPSQIAPSPVYQQRSADLMEILDGAKTEVSFFASSFRDVISPAQFRLLVTQLKTQYGEPIKISRIIPASANDGTVEIMFAKATLAFRMVLDSASPHPVVGLQVTGANTNDDSIAKIKQEFMALPGKAGFEIAQLDSDQPQILAAHAADQQFAIGSTFKLYVLAALSSKIDEGEKNWDDVVRLYRKSLPSGMIQNWPEKSPLTLQALATLMVSISDNSATDILMTELGNAALEETVLETGHGNPDKILPLLKTVEFFDLKMPRNAGARGLYSKANKRERLEILKQYQIGLFPDKIDIANLANKPVHIDIVEWFASPTDITGLLQKISQIKDPVVQNILKVNPIIPPGDALRWAYIGGKGGSEPGVISYAFLAKSKSGKTYAISGSWNNPDAPVDSGKFTTMMNRLLNLTAAR